jgi:small subunit ribosomal protein S20
MPNLTNAKKALRQSLKRAERNATATANIAFMRRSFRKLLEAKKVDDARTLLVDLTQALDKAVSKNILKKNTVARLKSRAALRLKAVVK